MGPGAPLAALLGRFPSSPPQLISERMKQPQRAVVEESVRDPWRGGAAAQA